MSKGVSRKVSAVASAAKKLAPRRWRLRGAPPAATTASSNASRDGGARVAAASLARSDSTSAAAAPSDAKRADRNGRARGRSNANASAAPRHLDAASKKRRASERTAPAGWHSAGAARRAAASTERLRSVAPDPARAKSRDESLPDVFVSLFVSPRNAGRSGRSSSSPEEGERKFARSPHARSSSTSAPHMSPRQRSAAAATSSESSARHRSTHGSRNASVDATPTNRPTFAMRSKNATRSVHARSFRQVINKGTKKSFASARPKKDARVSAPASTAARVAGPASRGRPPPETPIKSAPGEDAPNAPTGGGVRSAKWSISPTFRECGGGVAGGRANAPTPAPTRKGPARVTDERDPSAAAADASDARAFFSAFFSASAGSVSATPPAAAAAREASAAPRTNAGDGNTPEPEPANIPLPGDVSFLPALGAPVPPGVR